VLGATGILLVAFTWGIRAGLLVGAALYLLAGLLLALPRRGGSPPPLPEEIR
jgi:hypothetical protein